MRQIHRPKLVMERITRRRVVESTPRSKPRSVDRLGLLGGSERGSAFWLGELERRSPDCSRYQKALRVKLHDGWSRATPVFDDEHLVSCAGLVPVMGLAERSGLAELIDQRVRFVTSRVASAGVNPAGKLTAVIAGMAAGADCLDDLDLLRSGGMPALFAGVYAPATLGQHLREFTYGHTRQLTSVLAAHLVNLVNTTGLLPGISRQVFIDIDSLLRPTFGHAKQGASYGHSKIAGKQVLRKGLSPLVTTLSTPAGAPVIAGIRLRAGRAGSGKGAASMVTEAITVARACGASGEVLVRGDSAYGSSQVVAACRRAGARFSVVLEAVKFSV